MAHFTELNLQGKQDPKSGQNTTKSGQPLSAPGSKPCDSRPADNSNKPKNNHSDHQKLSNMQKRMALIGSFAAIALLAVTFVETSGCSKAANNSEAPAPTPMATNSAPAVQATPVKAAALATSAPVKKTAKKTVRKIPTATYKNADYGISFRYPTYDSFKDGVWTGLDSIPMNFVQPGGTALGTVQLPDDMYPGTDYASAFFSVSVNPKLTADECAEFSFPGSAAGDTSAESAPTPHKVKLGATEYSKIEVMAGDAQQSDAKYYHTFQNGNCYEFALGLQTAGPQAEATDTRDGTSQVKRSQVFPHLEWMLSTVAIKPAATPEVAAGAISPQPAAPEAKTPEATTPAQASETKAPETQSPEKTPEAKVIDDQK